MRVVRASASLTEYSCVIIRPTAGFDSTVTWTVLPGIWIASGDITHLVTHLYTCAELLVVRRQCGKAPVNNKSLHVASERASRDQPKKKGSQRSLHCKHATVHAAPSKGCMSAIYCLNPLEPRGNYCAITNNMNLVHWLLIGGLLHLVQRGGDWAGPQPAQAPPRCTKCNSSPINGQCTNHSIAVRCSAVLMLVLKG